MGVAQLVERRSVAPNVAGSIPVSHPNSKILVKTIPREWPTRLFGVRRLDAAFAPKQFYNYQLIYVYDKC